MPRLWPFGNASQETKAPGDYEANASIPMGVGQGYFQTQNVDVAEYAREAMNHDAIVYACIRALSTAAAEPAYRVMLQTSTQPVQASANNPIVQIIEKPNPEQDFYSFLDDLVSMLYVAGNVYLYKIRNSAGRMVGMRLLRPDRVTIKSDEWKGVARYEYEVNGKRYYISPSDLAHMKFANLANDLYGLSPLTPIAAVINLDLAQIEYAKSFFMNSGTPSGLLKVKRKIQNPDEASMIRSRWRSSFGGNNVGKLAVLDEDATYERLGEKISDMAFPELRDTTETRICMALGNVPPILIGSVVGLNRATYSNYREARKTWFYESMIPLAGRITRFLNNCFGYEFANAGYLEADFSSVQALTEDLTEITDRTTKQWDAGLISLNEARSALGLDPLDQGEVRRVPLTALELGMDETAPVMQLPAPTQTLSVDWESQKAAPPLLIPDSPYTPDADKPAPEGMQDYLNAMIELRLEEADYLEPKLDKFFKGLVNRVDGVLGRYMATDSDTLVIKLPISLDAIGLAGELLPIASKNDLTGILRPSYSRMIKKTFKELGDGRSLAPSRRLGPLKFDPKSMTVQRILAMPSSSANEIIDYTQKKLREAVLLANERGYTTLQLANGVADDGFKGVRQIARDAYSNRTRAIARTEMAKAQNAASIAYVQEQGEEWVQAYDPDGDSNDKYVAPGDAFNRTCAERHLQWYNVTRDQPYDIIDHPNGRLFWFPPEVRPVGAGLEILQTAPAVEVEM